MRAYLSEVSAVLDEVKTSSVGLSSAEAEKRFAEHGPNKLAEGKRRSLISRFLGELADPMILILIAAAIVSGVTAVYTGESFADVVIILTVVLINAILGVVQESKAERAIEALREIAAATSKVLRDGHRVTVKSEALVPGDIVILEAGDAVPADSRLIECASLKAEEAALTGESVPVTKLVGALTLGGAKDVPLGDRKNMVYMGSTVVYGRGAAVVVATGMDTEMGKIAGALTAAKDDETPLQKKLNALSKTLSILVLAICAVIFAVDIIRAYPDHSGERLVDTFMVAVSLAVAAIPEGLAAVVTIVLSIGVTNMSRRRAVIRRLTAVETLGCTQVICSDKTGTLTQNKMTVVSHAAEDVERLALAMTLCSDAKLNETGSAVGEPTECALVNDAHKLGLTEKAAAYTRVGEAPFDSMRKRMSVVMKAPDGELIQFTKGAPDEVLALCDTVWTKNGAEPMTDAWRSRILVENKKMADRALRVLCAAERRWETMPSSTEPGSLERRLCYLGLSGMIDPIRPEVRDAIGECGRAGIRPVMITGDHRDTAVAIARELGILAPGQEAITGAELTELSDDELTANIEKYSVYARVQPEHKVRIVNAWRAKGYITAMTGDGVNDAPSIKSADIGVGMGITGTDVTKNVADMVLADDNFATIVSAVEEGRRIYDNIRKSIQFLLSSNLAEVLSIFTATLMAFTILKPVHLLWINLITDTFPALALGMEKSEADTMERAPRNASDGIFSGGLGFDVAFQGVVITALTLAAYFIGHFMEAGRFEIVESPDGMTMAFLTLSLVEIFHAFNMRSRRGSIFTIKNQNKWLWGSMALSFVLTLTVIYVPVLSNAFGFEVISLAECVTAVALAVIIIPVMELYKLICRKLGK
ncbi:MAG: cation-translocating P-type ATPase [Clostridiaceae bacterium]|nr:cation-translocating P-type ATPase [Clostridiaceae bacterium]